MDEKILGIVQARMNSERLPGKVLSPILGIPSIIVVLKRLSLCKYIDELVVATSDRKDDDALSAVVSREGYKVFRGDENDVLMRYYECAMLFGAFSVLRVTGDCPFVDPALIDSLLAFYISQNSVYDYMRLDVPNTFPRGLDGEVFSFQALEKAYNQVRHMIAQPAPQDAATLESIRMYREHVTYFIYKNPEIFNTYLIAGSEPFRRNYRLCVDTDKDFLLITKVFEHFDSIYSRASDVLKYLDLSPEIACINSDIKQRF